MIEINQCPICGTTTFLPLTACKDFTVSHETFHVKQCTSCTLGITSPRPEEDNIPGYYKSEEYISHSGKSSQGIGHLYRIARSIALRQKRKLIQKFHKTGTLLDLGCGTGEFLFTMQQANWIVTGVEPSEIGRTKSGAITNTKIFKDISQINDKMFNAITAWHVVEHIPDLHKSLTKIKQLLEKNGVLFIAVPNYESPDAESYKSYWAAYDVPRHLWHFSQKSMKELLAKEGFTVTDILPMYLDSFYISMLSEKYKNGNRLTLTGLLKAIFSGLTSNFTARKKTNYSSLIYVARHAH